MMTRRTVLVIEDDPDIGALLEALLTDEGYRCVRCPSVAAALALLGRQRVDLILTDSFSPTPADVQAATAPLRQVSGGTPVALLTAPRRALAAGAAARRGRGDSGPHPARPRALEAGAGRPGALADVRLRRPAAGGGRGTRPGLSVRCARRLRRCRYGSVSRASVCTASRRSCAEGCV
jgi:DNA-binding NtrC family response regulator